MEGGVVAGEVRGRGGRDPGAWQLAHSRHARNAEARRRARGQQRCVVGSNCSRVGAAQAADGGCGRGVVWWVRAAAVVLLETRIWVWGRGLENWAQASREASWKPSGRERNSRTQTLTRTGTTRERCRQTQRRARNAGCGFGQDGSRGSRKTEGRRGRPRAFSVSCNLPDRASPSRSTLALAA